MISMPQEWLRLDMVDYMTLLCKSHGLYEMPLAPSLCSLANGYGFDRAFAAEALCRSMLEGHLGLVYGEKSLGVMCKEGLFCRW